MTKNLTKTDVAVAELYHLAQSLDEDARRARCIAQMLSNEDGATIFRGLMNAWVLNERPHPAQEK